MNLNNLEKIEGCFDARFTKEQQVMADVNMRKGFSVYVESYSDYCYVVLVKENVKGGVKRINRTGHNVQI